MGLSHRQAHKLLVYELAPLTAVALVAGGIAGLLLAHLIGPQLGLETVTGGSPLEIRSPWWSLPAALLLVAAALAVAVGTEQAANRRMNLGRSLRLGEEKG